jgi:hypothetical protein
VRVATLQPMTSTVRRFHPYESVGCNRVASVFNGGLFINEDNVEKFNSRASAFVTVTPSKAASQLPPFETGLKQTPTFH